MLGGKGLDSASNADSFAIFAAYASSWVSSFAPDRPAGHQLSGCVRQGESVGRHSVLSETPPPLAAL
jgi:hypothetical protein